MPPEYVSWMMPFATSSSIIAAGEQPLSLVKMIDSGIIRNKDQDVGLFATLLFWLCGQISELRDRQTGKQNCSINIISVSHSTKRIIGLTALTDTR